MKRRQQSSEGAYSITAKGVNTSAPTLGAAISKALTYAVRVQRELEEGEDVRSLYIRRLGEEAVGRVDVRKDLIQAFSLAPTR